MTATLDERELELRSLDGTPLWVRSVRPETARAQLAFVHGFAEHGGRYQETLRWFAERGFNTAVIDLRGHGRSGGKRTFVRQWADYVDDVEAYLGHVAENSGELPTFLIGHS
ncbi:lysophospholipase, partial [Planctomycetota bacterium]|nr:lysophospholipase [Planctomycetota bacterium]